MDELPRRTGPRPRTAGLGHVIAQVERAFGRQLPVSSLLEGRTIERLACLLRDEPAARSPLVAIHPRGAHPPVFWVHPLSGTVYCYVELAEALGDDRPCFGLQATGFAGGKPQTRIEDMARRYVQEVQRLQPAGPYRLGGWSMGGVVAFEMARQLEERGERVALLALLDPAPPGAGADGDDSAAGEPLLGFVQHLGLWPDDLTVFGSGLSQLDPSEQLACVLEQARRAGLVPPDLEVSELDRQLAVFTSNLEAMRHYAPAPYTGRVTLVEAAGSRHGRAMHGARWDDLALGGLVRHTVPGDHSTMLRRPHVGVLAERLTACLHETGASTP
ncbi:MAG TPA: thioesterase domain-containing protein [Egibacteraceae bacterium]|nr:thioesterase domain-containing protein [Egibacteraceae bacterium]